MVSWSDAIGGRRSRHRLVACLEDPEMLFHAQLVTQLGIHSTHFCTSAQVVTVQLSDAMFQGAVLGVAGASRHIRSSQAPFATS